jgi:hypothetical protein
MTEKFLRDQLVGAWELTSFIERDIKTGVENHPFGKHPPGTAATARTASVC